VNERLTRTHAKFAGADDIVKLVVIRTAKGGGIHGIGTERIAEAAVEREDDFAFVLLNQRVNGAGGARHAGVVDICLVVITASGGYQSLGVVGSDAVTIQVVATV